MNRHDNADNGGMLRFNYGGTASGIAVSLMVYILMVVVTDI